MNQLEMLVSLGKVSWSFWLAGRALPAGTITLVGLSTQHLDRPTQVLARLESCLRNG